MKEKILLLSVVLHLCTSAQEKSVKKQCRDLIKEARYHFEGEDHAKAWQHYRQVLALDPGNKEAGLNAAISLFRLNYPIDSLSPLAFNLSTSKDVDAKFYLAKIRHQEKNPDAAIALLNEYEKKNINKRTIPVAEITYLKNCCVNAKKFTAEPHLSIIKNMGGNINSPFQDYVPVISPDESALYFTSKRGDYRSAKNADNNFYEDVFVSYKENGKWSKAEPLGPPINSETNDACVAVSPDGQRMIIYRTASDIETGDLYITRLNGDNKWEPLQLMDKAINSEFIETSACFSNDTSEIYFSSDRPGGVGGKDLYRIKKLPNGRWSKPFNLAGLNTAYDEDAPFLHPDGVTLYFSSKGHNTMGEYDIFRSTLDSTNTFSAPENLGYPINDVGNDIFFVLSVDGQRGYYSSRKKETFGGLDIYEIDTRFGDNDLKVQEGTAYIANAPGRVKITLTDKQTGAIQGQYYSNPVSGRFIVVTNPLKGYEMTVEADDCETLTFELRPAATVENPAPIELKLQKTNAQ